MGQAGQRRAGLRGGCTQVIHCKSHHGTAADDLLRIRLEAARLRDELIAAHADAVAEVGRVRDRVAGDRHDTLDGRGAQSDRIVDRDGGADVVNDAARIRRQDAGVDGTAGDRVDQGALAALRILGQAFHDLDLRLVLQHLAKLCDGLRLVVLDADHALGVLEQLKHDLHAADELLRLFHHQTIVAGDVRFALCGIDDDVVDLGLILRRQLDMVRETRAAHTDDAACLHDVSDLLLGQLGVIPLSTKALNRLIQSVIFDDDRKHLASCRHRPRLDLLDLAGNGADDAGGNEPARLSDLLSNQDALADLDDRLGRSAEVL